MRVHGVPPYESESVAEGFEVGGGLLGRAQRATIIWDNYKILRAAR